MFRKIKYRFLFFFLISLIFWIILFIITPKFISFISNSPKTNLNSYNINIKTFNHLEIINNVDIISAVTNSQIPFILTLNIYGIIAYFFLFPEKNTIHNLITLFFSFVIYIISIIYYYIIFFTFENKNLDKIFGIIKTA